MTFPAESHQCDISVITISKDDLDGFKSTLKSVQNQKFVNLEVIVVIHETSHTTLEYARALELQDTRVRLVVDSGDGIYQAMNTGMKYARGKYLVFMNSGDKFVDHDSLKHLYQRVEKENAVLLIGDFRIKNRKSRSKEIIESQITAESFAYNRNWGCHQAMIFRKIDNQYYNLKYPLASDFEFVLRYFEFGKVFRSSLCVAEIRPGGLADINLNRVFLEKYEIRSERLFGLRSRILNILWTCLAFLKLYSKNLR